MGHFKWICTYICGVTVIMTGYVPYAIRSNTQEKLLIYMFRLTRDKNGIFFGRFADRASQYIYRSI